MRFKILDTKFGSYVLDTESIPPEDFEVSSEKIQSMLEPMKAFTPIIESESDTFKPQKIFAWDNEEKAWRQITLEELES